MKKNREDMHFMQLMEQVIKEEGKMLLEENKRLKSDPSAAIPEEVDRRMLEFIESCFQ